jgi:FkbM family methyltransferase
LGGPRVFVQYGFQHPQVAVALNFAETLFERFPGEQKETGMGSHRDVYNLMEAKYFGEEMQERDEIERLPQLLKNVTVFVDVGAGLGQYAFFANTILKGAKIFCIEADPMRFPRLKELASEWKKTSANQISVIHAAVAEKNGKVDFLMTNTNMSGGLFANPVEAPGSQKSIARTKVEVDCVSLDSLFKDSKPDFVKIDVEGAEYSVLLGARGILREGKCRFFVEVHPWGDERARKQPADVFQLLAQFGYDFRRVHRHWLFEKSGRPLKRYIKNAIIVFIMEHLWLKATLKKCVLALTSNRR